MEIYLLRHAIAVPRGTPGYPNDDRPLTAEGIEKMRDAAKGIARVVSGFDVILTSPLIRARETASIAAEATQNLDRIEICEHLLPESDIFEIHTCLLKFRDKDRVMLVGHEPSMSAFASILLGGKTSIIEFKKGSLCRIDIHRPPTTMPGTLIFHLQPKHLRAIGKIPKQLKVS